LTGTSSRAGQPPTLEQAFDNESLYALRTAVAAHATRAGLSGDRAGDLVLVVHELAANAIRHGAGHGRLRLWRTRDEVRCEVTDDGAPDARGPAVGGSETALWHIESGHGLWLIQQVADQASLASGPSGTFAVVVFRLASASPGDGGHPVE
jgi:anti-sigma regulatory factor (Ser/Thr protein kinase)